MQRAMVRGGFRRLVGNRCNRRADERVNRLARVLQTVVSANRQAPIRALSLPRECSTCSEFARSTALLTKIFCGENLVTRPRASAPPYRRKRCQAGRLALCTSFRTWMKCPFHSGFLNRPLSARGARARARQSGRRHRRGVSSRRAAMRERRADTRFVNPEAVFFVLL
jgi:hypothetical protein